MKKILLVSMLVCVALPALTFAAHNPINSKVFIPTILAGPLLLCQGNIYVTGPNGNQIPNPNNVCQNLCDLVAQIANVIYFFIAVVIWIISPILIAVGGLMIMLGGASPEMVGRGKKTITGAIWGIVIVLCAWLIVFVFVGAFGGLSKYIGGFGGANGQAACSI